MALGKAGYTSLHSKKNTAGLQKPKNLNVFH